MSKGWNLYKLLLEELGEETLLNALAQALSDDELLENCEFIIKEHDIDFDDEDEEEDEE